MPSGGARARSGPPPDPNALSRSRDAGEWWTLPAEGRSGPAPKWPLVKPSRREKAVWTELWRKPQAVAWEALGQEHEVALYVRRFVEAEEPGASPSLGTLVRQLGEGLGLTIPGMARNRWKIAKPEQEPVEVRPVRPVGARDRHIRAVK